MYCGSTLVSDGIQNPLSMTEVLAACGEPLERRRMANELVYNNNKNIVVLRFDTNGILQSLNTEFAAGKSPQEEKIEATNQAIREGKPIPVESTNGKRADPQTITKGKEADPRTSSRGRDASPDTVTKGVDASPSSTSETPADTGSASTPR
jgi:hypothetical protein